MFPREIDQYLARGLPPHANCACTGCDAWRQCRVVPGALVTGASCERKTWSWHPMGPLLWEKPVDVPVLVIAMPTDADRFDSHMVPTLVWSPTFGFRVTSAKWLDVLAGRRKRSQ